MSSETSTRRDRYSGVAVRQRLMMSTMAAMLMCVLCAADAQAQRQMEKLGRGVVALRQGDGKVFVGWRMLGTEPEEIAYNVYRSSNGGKLVKLNRQPIQDVTFVIDAQAKAEQAHEYTVRPVLNGREGEPSAPFALPANAPPLPYLSIPLQTPRGYSPNDASAADLDGDGEYEIILKQHGRSHDNAHEGVTDPVILQAYKLDGTLLWQINLGINIRAGAHYTQFMVYDFDGDGFAELICKAADGTTDGQGNVIGDTSADHRNESGRILRGPEFLTVFDGRTGKALATTQYLPPRHPSKDDPTADEMKAIWGDGYGNRMDRFLAGVAYLDGQRPSVIFSRGYYTRTVLTAWDWTGSELKLRWIFDSHDGSAENRKYAGQGAHSLSIADVTGDGRDEIIFGAAVIGPDGKGLHSSGWGHGDALHVTRMDPSNPRQLVFMPHESPRAYGPNGMSLRDAITGKLVAGVSATRDIGRGVAFDIDPRYPGFEFWGSGDTGGLYNVRRVEPDPERGPRAVPISSSKPGAMNFGVWWDGDELREMLDGTRIMKWDWEAEKLVTILDAAEHDCVSINGTKANPSLSADLFGDWREEVVWPTKDGTELRIFTTTIPTHRRLPTLMHDAQYRLAIAWQNVGYNQPPHPSFYLGDGMPPPPRATIRLVEPAPARKDPR